MHLHHYQSDANPLAVLNDTPHGHVAHLSPLNNQTMRSAKLTSQETTSSTVPGSPSSPGPMRIGLLSVGTTQDQLVGGNGSPRSPQLNGAGVGGGRQRMVGSTAPKHTVTLTPCLVVKTNG